MSVMELRDGRRRRPPRPPRPPGPDNVLGRGCGMVALAFVAPIGIIAAILAGVQAAVIVVAFLLWTGILAAWALAR